MNIIITGCTGVGKTEVGVRLARALGLSFLDEPFGDNPYMEHSYHDPSRYGLASQLWFIIAFAGLQLTWPSYPRGCVQERGMADCVRVFGRSLERRGSIGAQQMTLLENVFHEMNRTMPAQPDVIVGVEAPPELILERVRRRGRLFERRLGLDACREEAQLYKEWLGTIKTRTVEFANTADDLVDLDRQVEVLAATIAPPDHGYGDLFRDRS